MEWTCDYSVPYPGFVSRHREPGAGGMKVTVIGGGAVLRDPVFVPSHSTIRGGSYCAVAGLCRCASRLSESPAASLPWLGFRCVYSPDPAIQAEEQFASGDVKTAVNTFRVLVTMSPTHYDVAFNAAHVFRLAGLFDEAIEIWQRLLRSWPDDADAQVELDRCRRKDSSK
jgi:tetratricopeptide (TPR) repeat protein